MLATLLAACLLPVLPQQQPLTLAAAVAVRGDAELSPAAALASAHARVDDYVRLVWTERAQRTVQNSRPFWLPAMVTDEAVRRWLAELQAGQVVRLVDRQDRERIHEFGNSYQTTLWIVEEPAAVAESERRLREVLQRAERLAVAKSGSIAAGWLCLAVAIGWLDRLSRGYMSTRLRILGVLAGAAVLAAICVV